MNKTIYIAIISILVSSCSSLFYSNRSQNNTFTINSNVKNFEIKFPYSRNETYTSNNGNFRYTLPKLSRSYTTVDIVSKDYVSQRITLKKSVRIGPLLLDLLSFPLTLGIPVLVDVFKSDFYKISDDSKNNTITLLNTQSFMTSQFNKIKGTKNPEIYDRFIEGYPFSEKKELAINSRDSLEFKFALDSYNEQNITKFIQNRPTSIFIPSATKIEAEFVKNRIAFSKLETSSSVGDIENFIQESPNAIQIPKAHKLLVELAEKEALNSQSSSKKIIFLHNYLIPNKNYLSNSDYLVIKSTILSKILNEIEKEIKNKDYTTIKSNYLIFKSLDKHRIEQGDLNMFLNIYQNQLSEILFNDLLKIKSNQDQLSFESKIQTEFPDLFNNSNVVLKILEKNSEKNGLVTIYNLDFLSLEFDGNKNSKKYKNKPSTSFEYKNVGLILQNTPIKQLLNFKQNLLEGTQEIYFLNDLSTKLIVKGLKIVNTEYLLKNKLIGIEYFDNSGGFLYKYEFENETNLTLKKLDENISQYDNMVSRKNFNEALIGYQNLQHNRFPKELKQNLVLISKIENCEKLIQKRDLEIARLRKAEEARQEKIRIIEEKKQEKIRLAEERRLAKSRKEQANRQSNNNRESYNSQYSDNQEDDDSQNTNSQKFCFDDTYGSSGMKFEITLYDGGAATLNFKSDGVLRRSGNARWSKRSGIAEGYGENDIVTLRLSTGAVLTFTAVKSLMGSFTMLIDSTDRQYIQCF
jgi:hypothetical protein